MNNGEGSPRDNNGRFYPFEAVARCPACRVAYALCPPDFHETSFGDFVTATPEQVSRLARCREFAAQVNRPGGGFLVLVGRTGTDKTRLASNIVRELRNPDALYVRQGQLTVALRASYGVKEVVVRRFRDDDSRDEDAEPTVLAVTQRVRFLILDELGCLPLANDERLLLDEMLKHRHDHHLPTVLLSNLPLDQLNRFLGDALADRASHAAGNGRFVLQFNGPSYRRSAGEDYLESRP